MRVKDAGMPGELTLPLLRGNVTPLSMPGDVFIIKSVQPTAGSQENAMQQELIITCALTGAGETTAKNPNVPVTPEQIARAALEARQAGAAIVHIHVRDPETGAPARDFHLYQDVVTRLREADSDLIINLTTGMGGEFIPDETTPNVAAAGSDMASAEERIAHIRALAPDMCSLDCGSMNLRDVTLVSSANQLRIMARGIREAGVRPELEVFDLGHIQMAKQLIAEGLIAPPPLFQLCLGVAYGAPADVSCMLAMRNQLPADAIWSGFALGRDQFPFAAHAMLLGGNIRVGLEDNLYLEKGVLADNASLVEKAVQLARLLGRTPVTPDRARELLHLPFRP